MTQQNIQSKELSFALEIARQAGEIALSLYKTGITAEMKSDNTPVTDADKRCEKLIRQAIREQFPNDAIIGEEEGETVAQEGTKRKWIIDPIDGTYNYAREVPIWSILIALEENHEVKLGVVHAPAMNETYWAERGAGAYKNGKQIQVSKIRDVGEAMFVFGAPSRFSMKGLWAGLKRVVDATYRQRAFGDYINFGHVFQGKAEAAVEVDLKVWDIAPMKIIIEEAGGKFTDLGGGGSIYTGSCLVSNGLVHNEILQLLMGG